ncbi:isochorismatase family protein [Musicola paradisiaca]|uniref:Isochorismatase hydrolase n=1 Tax=Musicola paradisiaca (strain Ech703) TaxID=579405 RepID=C6C6H6_MUSP7|nr:isochorismatase family protein [Musicola paradisiaca]ACS83895.1 isochorismatase hydrolase [Musicola paradisiaca Ech703]
MAQSALLVIDVQNSFLHRPFWTESDVPAFQTALLRLIDGCQRQGVAIADVFHVSQGPFSLASGHVVRQSFLTHRSDIQVHKHVHNALTESGLLTWLQQQEIRHLIISGIRTEQCCETTARVASDLGYRVTFVTEATLTFPMTHDGLTLSSGELKHRTETVLIDRFAAIRSVDACLAELEQTS